MLMDREIVITTIMDDEFNVIAGLFLDGRAPITINPIERTWPRSTTGWRDDGPITFYDGEVIDAKGRTCKAKIVVDRTEEFDVVWSGNMPDQLGGYTKGELLGQDGYDMCATATAVERARLIPPRHTARDQDEY